MLNTEAIMKLYPFLYDDDIDTIERLIIQKVKNNLIVKRVKKADLLKLEAFILDLIPEEEQFHTNFKQTNDIIALQIMKNLEYLENN